MHDEKSGRPQQGGWEPPEYVSPWLPASGSGDDEGKGRGDTISFGGPAYDAPQRPPSQPRHRTRQGSTRAPGYPTDPGHPSGPAYGPGPAAPGYGPGGGYGGPSYRSGPGYCGG